MWGARLKPKASAKPASIASRTIGSTLILALPSAGDRPVRGTDAGEAGSIRQRRLPQDRFRSGTAPRPPPGAPPARLRAARWWSARAVGTEQEAAGEVPKERLALGQEVGVVDVVAGDPPRELGERGGEQREGQLGQDELGRVEVGRDAPGLLLGPHRRHPGLAGGPS